MSCRLERLLRHLRGDTHNFFPRSLLFFLVAFFSTTIFLLLSYFFRSSRSFSICPSLLYSGPPFLLLGTTGERSRLNPLERPGVPQKKAPREDGARDL